jgi:23S rRNA (guanosine2251-2'-O)-methyltransferase
MIFTTPPDTKRQIIVIANNLRSIHNAGSLLRTADGLGIDKVILCGYTPHPSVPNDPRLPHEAAKITRQIHKTALGAEESMDWEWQPDVFQVINRLKTEGYKIAALEQTANSTTLPDFSPPNKIALILGREVEGVEPEVLEQCEISLEIPMFGQKESFNVTQAAAIAMYHIKFSD